MAITDEEYGFIISLCEWNDPDGPYLQVQAQNPGRLNLRPTLVQLVNAARARPDPELEDITVFMNDYLTTVNNDSDTWFAEIEQEVRINYG